MINGATKTNGISKNTRGYHSSPVFSLQQQERGLMEADRIIELSFLPSPILVGKTLRSLLEGGLDVNKIELALLKSWLGSPGQSEFRHVQKVFSGDGEYKAYGHNDFKWDFDNNLISYTSVSGVPVSIQLIEKNTPYFGNLDCLSYPYIFIDAVDSEGAMMMSEGIFSVPNPKVEYLKSIGLGVEEDVTRPDLLTENILNQRKVAHLL